MKRGTGKTIGDGAKKLMARFVACEATGRTWMWTLVLSVLAVSALAAARAEEAAVLVVPRSALPLRVAIDLPAHLVGKPGCFALVEQSEAATRVPAQRVARLAPDGTVADPRGSLVAVIPPGASAGGPRRFCLECTDRSATGEAARLRLATIDDRSIKISEGDAPVLAYNYGMIVGQNVPALDRRRERSCYIHPVWGLSGEIVTDDFPRDHYHHHGIFWAWPHVHLGDKEFDLWTQNGIQQRFVRWLDRRAGPVAAVLGVENGWFVGEKQVMIERMWIRVYGAGGRDRVIDLDLFLVPRVELALRGAPGKSYGGLTMRFRVRDPSDVVIRVPEGRADEDLKETPLAWVDVTTRFEGAAGPSGAAVFVRPDHPDYPPTWLTRHYGAECVGWPGVKARLLEPDKPIRLPYRVWLHRDAGEQRELEAEYAAYVAATQAAWNGAAAE